MNLNLKFKLLLGSVRDFPPYYLKAFLCDAGIIPSHDEYRRFVIIARPRTGTNLLRSMLNAHGQVLAFGEVFRDPEFIGWGMPYYPRIGPMRRLLERDPVRFLERVVYRRYPKRIRAVGFKIFYAHARNPEWLPLWDHLRERKELTVIHVRRRNLLGAYLSQVKARQTGVWETRRGTYRDPGPVMLDYGQCRHQFEVTRRQEQACDEQFSGHLKLDLYYEDLATDHAGQMRRALEALGVPYREVSPGIRKQGSRPLAESIANYAELRERFAGSPWEGFFEG